MLGVPIITEPAEVSPPAGQESQFSLESSSARVCTLLRRTPTLRFSETPDTSGDLLVRQAFAQKGEHLLLSGRQQIRVRSASASHRPRIKTIAGN
jgi:hypothetical protein